MSSAEVHQLLQQALGAAYTIERELGGGGMSRVFVADEAALGRKVVVKVLRHELAEGLSAERFKREVRVAARLQHPHIVPLLAAGEVNGGVLYYTMPFVEGQSLRERVEREGGLPVTEVARVMRDVASALAYAHRAGVVHRDIKPDNILLADGGAVVADFGIAKAISASREAGADTGTRRSATLTAAGTSLGTPAYMAPEQAAGDAVDHRADLYALGVVAYEMLAGRAPFEGRTAQQLLAAHATEAPDPIARRRAAVPPDLGTLVMRLLEKHPGDRPQSADEVLRALEELGQSRSAADAAEVPSREKAAAPLRDDSGSVSRPLVAPHIRALPRAAALSLVGLAGVAIGVLAALVARPGETPRRAVIATLAPPEGHELRPGSGVALSPDGARLAFSAVDERGASALWVRALDSLRAVRVTGTEGATGPFWSPDGASLGFFAGGQLRVVDFASGIRRALCSAPRPGGGTWTRNDVIVFAPNFLGGQLLQVPAGGGPCRRLTSLPQGVNADYRRPSALPDGRHVLFSSSRENVAFVVDLETGEVAEVRRPGSDAQFASPHWMLFRDEEGGPLYAQRLDMRTLRPVGEPRNVLERITSGLAPFAGYAASAHAIVALEATDLGQPLLWMNRLSEAVDSVIAPVGTGSLFGNLGAGLSRDGRRVVFGGLGMWIYDRDRRVATRLRAETAPGQGLRDPSFSPGDSLIAYATLFRGPLMLRVYHVGTGRSDSLFASGRRAVRTPDWSPDGRRIVFGRSAGDTVPTDELWIYSLADRRASRVWEAAANLSTPRWSPDGLWLAYVSDETGAPEVYMRRVAGSDVAVRVSTAGGDLPRWRADGRELFYRAPDGAILAVDVALSPAVRLSAPRTVVAGSALSRSVRGFDVTADGRQFVAFGRGDPPVFTLVLDWAERMPER